MGIDWIRLDQIRSACIRLDGPSRIASSHRRTSAGIVWLARARPWCQPPRLTGSRHNREQGTFARAQPTADPYTPCHTGIATRRRIASTTPADHNTRTRACALRRLFTPRPRRAPDAPRHRPRPILPSPSPTAPPTHAPCRPSRPQSRPAAGTRRAPPAAARASRLVRGATAARDSVRRGPRRSAQSATSRALLR